MPAAFVVPGARAEDRTHWLFAVDAAAPRELVSALRARGFDASSSTSAIHAVAPPPERPGIRAVESEALLKDLVFLPVHPGLAERDVEQLLADLQAVADRTGPWVREPRQSRAA